MSKTKECLMNKLTPEDYRLNLTTFARKHGLKITTLHDTYKKLLKKGDIRITIETRHRKTIETLEWKSPKKNCLGKGTKK